MQRPLFLSIRQLNSLRRFPTLTLRCQPLVYCSQQTNRYLSVTQCKEKQQIISELNIINSSTPDITIPDITFHQHIFNRCEKFKNNVALEEYLTGDSCTYAELKERSVKVANSLHLLGLRKGDVILCFSTNCINFTILMLACSSLGVWFSPANPTFTPGELVYQLKHGEATSVFVHPDLSDTMDEALKEYTNVEHKFSFGEVAGYQQFNTLLSGDSMSIPDVTIDTFQDVLTLPYSSGTTGLPKGVMLTHRNCVANVLQTAAHYATSSSLSVDDSDIALGLLPLYHIYGMVVVQFGVLQTGGKMVFLPKFEPQTFLSCIQDKKLTFAHLVPPLIVFLAKHPMVDDYDLSSLKTVVCGAAPLGLDTSEEFVNRHKQINFFCQGYGLTETSPVTNLDMSQTFGCAGQFVPNTQGKIVDSETGKALGVGEAGELCVKGPQIMKGYFNNKKATDDMISADGWLSTGDIAIYDEEGKIFIIDRLKELIKYKGSQVAPAELESILLSHPAVLDAAVIGVADEEAGELPKAFVVRKPGLEVDEVDIVQFVSERVSKTKRLRGGVQFIDEIPKNPSGKILRRVLRSQYS